jgi:hypothetical protein
MEEAVVMDRSFMEGEEDWFSQVSFSMSLSKLEKSSG